MELRLEYYMLWIEKVFYENNLFLLDEERICNAQKKLPCNCLTGLIMNYWAYVVNNCQRIDLESRFDIKENVSRILVTYKEKRIIPTTFDEIGSGEYWLLGRVCNKAEVIYDKIYIEKPAVEDYEYMVRYISETEEERNIVSEYEQIYGLMARFITAVRTQPAEKEGRVLFALMLFFFPNRTLKLVYGYMCGSQMKEDEKEYIKEFMEKYDIFLNALNAYKDYGFLSGFSALFEKLTGIYVGEWIEEIIGKQEEKRKWWQALRAAYNRNIEERGRRTSLYKKIMNVCM